MVVLLFSSVTSPSDWIVLKQPQMPFMYWKLLVALLMCSFCLSVCLTDKIWHLLYNQHSLILLQLRINGALHLAIQEVNMLIISINYFD